MAITISRGKDYWQASGSVMGKRIRRRFDLALPRSAVQKMVDVLTAEAVEEALESKRRYPRKTLADACRLFLRERKTLAQSGISYVRRLSRELGTTKLTEVDAPMLREWARGIEGVTDPTRKGMLALAAAVMRHACEAGWCPEVRVNLSGFESSPVRNRFLSEEEETLLLWHTPEYLWPFVLMALKTGARSGELRRLRWQDVTESEGRTLIKLRHRKGFTGDDWRERHVPLNERAMEALREQARLNGQASVPLAMRKGYVFRNLWGEPWRDGNQIVSVFADVVEKAGLEDVKLHDLRRTFASRLVARGVDMRTVSELMGHSTMAMMERYAHLSPGVADAAVAML